MVTNARGTSPSPEKEKESEDVGLVLCGWETKNAVNMLNYEHKKFEEKDVFRLVTSEGRSEFLFVPRS